MIIPNGTVGVPEELFFDSSFDTFNNQTLEVNESFEMLVFNPTVENLEQYCDLLNTFGLRVEDSPFLQSIENIL
jgi:hypothetical protein